MRRYNLHAEEMNRVIAAALAGQEVGNLVEGNRRIPIVVRLAEDSRQSVEAMKRLPVRTEEGAS